MQPLLRIFVPLALAITTLGTVGTGCAVPVDDTGNANTDTDEEGSLDEAAGYEANEVVGDELSTKDIRGLLGAGDWSYKFDVVEANGSVKTLHELDTQTLRRPASTLKIFTGYAGFTTGAASNNYIGDTLKRSSNSQANNILCLVGEKRGNYNAVCQGYEGTTSTSPSFPSGMRITTALSESRDLLDGLGVKRTQGSNIADGSGLSYGNQLRVTDINNLLQVIHKSSRAAEFRGLLANPKTYGTLAGKFSRLADPGRIYAKTGTLRDVKALAGYADMKNGRWLVFSVIGTGVQPAAAFPRIESAVIRAMELAKQ
jgi:D-Ala-D-Ala carboxypeptidase 3 (S13) family